MLMYAGRYSIFVLVASDGRILLQHRDSGAPRNPEGWSFFGGSMEEGETPEQAVKREAKEELGISPEFKLVGRYEIEHPEDLVEKFVFSAPLDIPLERLKEQLAEGDDLGVFNLGETKELKFWEPDRIILNDILSREALE